MAAADPIPGMALDGNAMPGDAQIGGSIIDVGRELGSVNDVKEVSGTDRLKFARQILFYLFLICLLVFGAYILQPDNAGTAAIFELLKVGILPLVTLVIGFYFPNSNNR